MADLTLAWTLPAVGGVRVRHQEESENEEEYVTWRPGELEFLMPHFLRVKVPLPRRPSNTPPVSTPSVFSSSSSAPASSSSSSSASSASSASSPPPASPLEHQPPGVELPYLAALCRPRNSTLLLLRQTDPAGRAALHRDTYHHACCSCSATASSSSSSSSSTTTTACHHHHHHHHHAAPGSEAVTISEMRLATGLAGRGVALLSTEPTQVMVATGGGYRDTTIRLWQSSTLSNPDDAHSPSQLTLARSLRWTASAGVLTLHALALPSSLCGAAGSSSSSSSLSPPPPQQQQQQQHVTVLFAGGHDGTIGAWWTRTPNNAQSWIPVVTAGDMPAAGRPVLCAEIEQPPMLHHVVTSSAARVRVAACTAADDGVYVWALDFSKLLCHDEAEQQHRARDNEQVDGDDDSRDDEDDDDAADGGEEVDADDMDAQDDDELPNSRLRHRAAGASSSSSSSSSSSVASSSSSSIVVPMHGVRVSDVASTHQTSCRVLCWCTTDGESDDECARSLLAVGCSDGTVVMVDPDAGERQRTVAVLEPRPRTPPFVAVTAISWTTPSRRLAVARGLAVEVLHLVDPCSLVFERVCVLSVQRDSPQSCVRNLAWSEDCGSLACTTQDRAALFSDVEGGIAWEASLLQAALSKLCESYGTALVGVPGERSALPPPLGVCVLDVALQNTTLLLLELRRRRAELLSST